MVSVSILCEDELDLSRVKVEIDFGKITSTSVGTGELYNTFYFPDTDFKFHTYHNKGVPLYNNGIQCIPVKLPIEHFPLVALNDDYEIKIHAAYDGKINIESIRMIATFYMLDMEERNRYIQFGHEYLIHSPIRTIRSINNSLEFKIPHYSDIITHVVISFHNQKKDLYTDGKIKGSLCLDGFVRDEFDDLTNMHTYSKLGLNYKKGYYLISYQINYNSFQPSGRMNVKDLELSIKLKNLPYELKGGSVQITTFHYNVFRILNQMCGIAFPIENLHLATSINLDDIDDDEDKSLSKDDEEYDSELEVTI